MIENNHPLPSTNGDSAGASANGVPAGAEPAHPERRELPTPSRSVGKDVLAGFLVFLIALPLCLGISLASGYPLIAGIFTAIIGGLLTTCISNSQLTIKGPAAGLITIAFGCIVAFGGGPGKSPEENMRAYQLALAVGVAAGLIQLALGLLKMGDIIGDFFPTAAVHGMLASIGVIIAVKQFHYAFGVQNVKGGAFAQIAAIPHSILYEIKPQVALIGILSLLILFGMPLIKNKYLRRIPSPMLVLLVAIPLGLFFDLHHVHNYNLGNRTYVIGPKYQVNLPTSMFDGISHPNFEALTTAIGWKFVLMFMLVGSLESLLSAKAIDLLDPWRRKTSLNRDLTAIGLANTVSAAVGGLPMISEIVRSKANIDNGARTRMADLYHALFLLVCVALIPSVLNHIPLAALAAMLVYTGCRLASPREFIRAYKVGREQFAIFMTTLIVTLATDLLVGIAAGVAVEILIHLINGAPLSALVKPPIVVEARDDRTCSVVVKRAAVFTNWLWLKKTLDRISPDMDVVLDLSETRLVDHTVMEKLHDLEREYEHNHRKLTIVGLEDHRPFSDHPHAARKKAAKQEVAAGV
jgi:MFS superfamily sulfate permease-like transporter